MEALNEFFNSFVDVSLIVATRLGELPFAFMMVLVLIGVSGVFGLKLLWQLARRRREPLWGRYVRAQVITLAVGTVVHLAQRTDLLLSESRELQYYARRDALSAAERSGAHATALRLIDAQVVSAELSSILGPVDFSAGPLADGVEFASFHSLGRRKVSGYVSVVDLTRSGLEIEITDEFGEKSLTSEFAHEHDCLIAINGEAGKSPARHAPLASYVGCWIVNGERLTLEPGHRRPFLAFDRANRGSYHRAHDGDVDPGEGTLNALWGRGDLLLAGEFVSGASPRWSRPNPRTLMGLDASGTRLVLMVVDGRQWGYSVGVDLETSARLMGLFGARDAMWCDQGGSSTMFVGLDVGVVNRPSDGKERPVYTHFGVSLHEDLAAADPR